MARLFDTSEFLYRNATPPVIDMPLTMSCLFYPTLVNLTRGLGWIVEDGGDQWYLFCMVGGDVQAYIRSGGTTPNAQATASCSADTWYHGAAVFASSTSRAAYLNGGNKGTNSTSCSPDGAQLDQLSIAKTTNNFEGYIAEWGLWDVALTDEEIATLGNFVSPLMVRPQNLVAYFPFIRDNDADLVGGLSMSTFGSPGIAAHPRVFYIPHQSISPFVPKVTVTLDTLTLSSSVPSATVIPGGATIALDALTLSSSVPSFSVSVIPEHFRIDHIQTTFNLPRSVRSKHVDGKLAGIDYADRQHSDTSKGKL